MKKTAIAIYGSPGSGKGTQAELLVKQYGFFHFDTGQYLRRLLYDPKNKNDKEIQKEQKLNAEGTLNTPSFVLKRVKKETKRISRMDQSIVYSGSPRTLFEAFGDAKNEGLLALLKKEYGPKNVFIVQLLVSPRVAAKRNASRLMCSVCGQPILSASKAKTCSFCGAPAKRRVDDNPKLFAHRLDQYQKRTFPILAKAARRGYQIKKVNGEPAPYRVHAKIVSLLKFEK